jgi:N6-adenosine-specific RNA methylase IME4
MSQYDVLVVDPPWAYGSAGTAGKPGSAEGQYGTIGNAGREISRRTGAGVENIIASVPIQDWAAPNAHLYLWTTNPKIPFAFRVMEEWGFVYKATLTWVKTASSGGVHGGGMGFFFRGATEHVLFGVRGRKPIPPVLRKPNVIMAPPRGHSVKPDEFYALVGAVSAASDRKIDVFARRERVGWDVWGNEVTSSLARPVAL